MQKQKKTNAATVHDSAKTAQKPASLELIFHQERSLAWQMLEAQSHIYSASELSLQKISELSSLYMKLIQKLNSLQDPREQYFSYKMQKLMSEPYIIRFFNNQHAQTRNALDDRRKLLEQRIQQEAERHHHRKVVERALQIQTQKEQRVRNRIRDALEHADKQLQERIQKRARNRLEKSMQFTPLSPLQNIHSTVDQDESLTSSGSIKNRFPPAKSSDFDSLISQDERFKELKRELEQQQQEQRTARWLLGDHRQAEHQDQH